MTRKKMAESKRAEIVRKIKAERELQNLSQIALEEIAEIANGTISSIESGRHGLTLNMLIQLADALYVPISYLVGEEMDEVIKKYEMRNRELEVEVERLKEANHRAQMEEIERLEKENKELSQYKWILRKVQVAVRDV